MLSDNMHFETPNKKRKPEFRINTRIDELGQNKVLIKSADNPSAFDFIETIIQRENLSKQFFGDYAEVITGTLRGGRIYYPYLNYPTLEELIAEAIRKDDGAFGTSIIEEYKRFLDKLPSKESRPMEFMRELGIHNEELKVPVRCFLIGPIDCIPANILVNGKSWYVIDHEWTYGFPMPIDFLIYRGVYSLIIHLQKLIQSHISIEKPAVLFSGYAKNRTYMPFCWLTLLHSTKMPIEKLCRWEWLFQSKVNVSAKLGRLRLKETPRIVTSVKPVSPWISALISICSWLRWRSIRYTRLLKDKLSIRPNILTK